jgi:hypothetical protein
LLVADESTFVTTWAARGNLDYEEPLAHAQHQLAHAASGGTSSFCLTVTLKEMRLGAWPDSACVGIVTLSAEKAKLHHSFSFLPLTSHHRAKSLSPASLSSILTQLMLCIYVFQEISKI